MTKMLAVIHIFKKKKMNYNNNVNLKLEALKIVLTFLKIVLNK